LGLYFSREKNPAAALGKWKLPSKKIKLLKMAFACLQSRKDHPWTAYRLFSAGKEAACLAETVYLTIMGKEARLDALLGMYEQLPIKSRKELAADGNDVIAWAQKQGGPWVGKALDEAVRAVINGEIDNRKENIRSWMENCRLI
jgi:tRNA nucleotidyltransferase (CCA-adding enzyme)